MNLEVKFLELELLGVHSNHSTLEIFLLESPFFLFWSLLKAFLACCELVFVFILFLGIVFLSHLASCSSCCLDLCLFLCLFFSVGTCQCRPFPSLHYWRLNPGPSLSYTPSLFCFLFSNRVLPSPGMKLLSSSLSAGITCGCHLKKLFERWNFLLLGILSYLFDSC